jgi:hypothetical protein
LNRLGPIERLRGRGLGTILRRGLREFYAPDTRVGRALRPLTAVLWTPVRLARRAVASRHGGGAGAWDDTLTLFYDLDVAPVTYDFICFLALAEAERRERGLRHLDVVFVPGRKDGLRAELRAYEDALDMDSRRWRLHNICIPLTALAPGCRSYAVCASREQAAALYAGRGDQILPQAYDPVFPMPPMGRDLTQRAAQGLDLKVLRTPPQGMTYLRQWIAAHAGARRLVTITLRDYAFMPERNSNFAAWAAFAGELDPARYCVVFIPDTDAAMARPRPEFAGFLEFREACWNIALRSAIYEAAWLNLGSSGGPLAVCWFNAKARYLMFKILVPDVPQATAAFLIDRGYKIGAPPPFAGPFQKWIWEPDDLAVIRGAFAEMAQALAAQGDAAAANPATYNPSANP